MKSLIVIGASGHGKVVADIALANGYTDIAFLDDDSNIHECGGYEVLGATDAFVNYEADFVVAIGNSKIRERIQKRLEEAGKNIAILVHPQAVIGSRVEIGQGTVVMPGAVVNADSVIGRGCIINTCASVDHDNVVGDYVHVSVGSHLAGTVHVGDHTWVGIGAVVSNNINICNDCKLGAGAVVIGDLIDEGTYVGCPAKKIR